MNENGTWIEFLHSEYWDVPRWLVFEFRGKYYHLRSDFDEELDDYPDEYTIFAIDRSEFERAKIEQNWVPLFINSVPCGSVKIKDVRFDESRRKEIYVNFLE